MIPAVRLGELRLESLAIMKFNKALKKESGRIAKLAIIEVQIWDGGTSSSVWSLKLIFLHIISGWVREDQRRFCKLP